MSSIKMTRLPALTFPELFVVRGLVFHCLVHYSDTSNRAIGGQASVR